MRRLHNIYAQIEILNKEGFLDENIHILSCYKESSISVNNFNHFTARDKSYLGYFHH